MKKIICLFIILLTFLTGCTTKKEKSVYDQIIEKDKIVVGVKTNIKPFGFIDEETQENKGFDIDIAKYIAKDILGSDTKIKFVKVTSNTRVEAITSKKVDMVIATMSVTPQRAFLVDFSVPYYVAGQTAVVKKDSKIYNYSDLKRKKVIVILGTTAEQNVRRIIPMARIIGFKDYDDAYNALLNDEADALISDDTILADFILKHKNYRLLSSKLSKEPYAIAIRKEEDNKKLKQALDVIINRMNKEGTLKYLNNKWHL